MTNEMIKTTQESIELFTRKYQENMAVHNRIKPKNMINSSGAIVVTLIKGGFEMELPLIKNEDGTVVVKGSGYKPSEVAVFDNYNLKKHEPQIKDMVNSIEGCEFVKARHDGGYWKKEADSMKANADMFKKALEMLTA